MNFQISQQEEFNAPKKSRKSSSKKKNKRKGRKKRQTAVASVISAARGNEGDSRQPHEVSHAGGLPALLSGIANRQQSSPRSPASVKRRRTE